MSGFDYKSASASATRRPLKDSADKREPRAWILILVTVLFVAGMMQSPLATILPNLPNREAIDDIVLLTLASSMLLRLGHIHGITFILFATWIVGIGSAILLASVPLGEALVIARQLAVPMLLIFIGILLHDTEWQIVIRVGIYAGIISAAYMCVEFFGIYIFNPASIKTFSSGGNWLIEGLPRYYFYWTSNPEVPRITRLGGLVLNPPIAGLMVATAFVALWHARAFKYRRFWLVVLLFVTIFSFSRGGWLIALAGTLIPGLVNKFGKLGTFLITVPIFLFAAQVLSGQGGSASHSQGLRNALVDALVSPLGQGFGGFGNYSQTLRYGADDGETLLGIAFNGFGLTAVLIVVVILIVLWQRIGKERTWEASLAVGAIISGLLSESAGALNGTAFLWLTVGVALQPSTLSSVTGAPEKFGIG